MRYSNAQDVSACSLGWSTCHAPFPPGAEIDRPQPTPPDIEIVGVIADTKYNGVRDPILNTVYLPAGQTETLVRLQNEE